MKKLFNRQEKTITVGTIIKYDDLYLIFLPISKQVLP